MTLDSSLTEMTTSAPSLLVVTQSPKIANQLLNLEQPTEILRVRESEFIFRSNEVPKGLFFVKSGCVKIITQRDQARGRLGRVEHISKLVGPGEFFGFKALMRGTPYSFSAKSA